MQSGTRISFGINKVLSYLIYVNMASMSFFYTNELSVEVSCVELWSFLQDEHIPRLITPAEKGRDLEARVLDTYIIQSQAEAQEGSA